MYHTKTVPAKYAFVLIVSPINVVLQDRNSTAHPIPALQCTSDNTTMTPSNGPRHHFARTKEVFNGVSVVDVILGELFGIKTLN